MQEPRGPSRAANRLAPELGLSSSPSDATLRALYAAFPAGIVETDLDQRIVRCNRAFAAMVGLGVEQIVGRPGWEFFHADSPPPQPAAVEDLIAGRRDSYSVQRLLETASGSALPVQLDWVHVQDPDQGSLLMCVVTDVSVSVAANAELLRARSELVRRQALTDAVLETVDVGIVFCEADGSNPVRNRAHRKLLGFSERQAGATPEALARVVDVLDETGVPLTPDRYPLSRSLRGETISNLDVRVGPVGGPYRDVVTSATPIMTPDGDLVGAVAASADVTAERAALRELADERTLLAEAQRIGQLGSFNYDVPSGRFAFSPELYRIWGLPQSADLAALRASMIHPDDLDRVVAAWRAGLGRGGRHITEFRIVRPDGAVRHLRSSMEVAHDDSASPVTVHGTHLDVTDLTVAQREATDANTLFKAILTATPDFTFVTDVRAGALVFGSPGKTILGVTAEQLEELGPQIIATLVHPDDRDRAVAANVTALDLADGEVLQLAHRARNIDGSWHWLSRRVTPFRRDPVTGKVIEVLGIMRDINDEHRTELSLRDSEARFRELVTQVVDYAIIGLDPDGVIQSWNTGAERLKGYTAEQAVGQSFEMFYPPEDLAAALPQHLLQAARSVGRVESSGWRVRRDSTRFWANVVITALHDQDGELSGFVKVTRDLTEQHRLEAAQASLFATISHDLKTPVTVIKMLAEMISDVDPDTRIEFGQRIASHADHLVTLVEELADYANLRDGTVPIRPEPLALSELARACILGLGPLLEGYRVHVADTDADTTAMVDRIAMQRILSNVIGNAAKYSAVGSALTISFEQTDATVRLAVSDEGRGIAREDLDTIFDEFARGRMAEVDGGTGLGLASARRLVELQGGSVWIESEVGRGTTVTLELPRA